jgi:hypothetical protein
MFRNFASQNPESAKEWSDSYYPALNLTDTSYLERVSNLKKVEDSNLMNNAGKNLKLSSPS